MNIQNNHAVKIFHDSLESITGSETLEKAESTTQLTRGYLVGIRLLNLINDSQYDAMNNLLEIATQTARKHIKKAAHGVTSTESDKANEYKSSVDENRGDVKSSGYTAQDLALALKILIAVMKESRISDEAIFETIFSVLSRRTEAIE